jgi:VanZ family protein
MKTKVAALSFLLLILLLIASADAGRMPVIIQRMHDFPNGDRVGHVVLYGILAFLLTRAFPRRFLLGRLPIPITFIVLVVFTTAEEWSQACFAARTADAIDLVCSYVGLAIGSWAASRRSRMPATS